MSIAEYAGLGVFLVAVIGIVWRISFILNQKVSYDSLDRCKREVQVTFVSKDVFTVVVEGFRSDIKEMRSDVKALLRKANGKS